MKNKIIGAIGMFLLLIIPALIGLLFSVAFWKGYVIALITTLCVMVASSLINYLNKLWR